MNVFSAVLTLGNDAETRFLTSGSAIVSFSGANNIGFGENKKTLWIRCSIFGKRGESLSAYLLKGAKVFVSGEINLNEFQGKDGLTRSTLELRVIEIELLGDKKKQLKQSTNDSSSFDDQDIPF